MGHQCTTQICETRPKSDWGRVDIAPMFFFGIPRVATHAWSFRISVSGRAGESDGKEGDSVLSDYSGLPVPSKCKTPPATTQIGRIDECRDHDNTAKSVAVD